MYIVLIKVYILFLYDWFLIRTHKKQTFEAEKQKYQTTLLYGILKYFIH